MNHQTLRSTGVSIYKKQSRHKTLHTLPPRSTFLAILLEIASNTEDYCTNYSTTSDNMKSIFFFFYCLHLQPSRPLPFASALPTFRQSCSYFFSIYLLYRVDCSPMCLVSETWLVTPKNFRPIVCLGGNERVTDEKTL